MLFQIYFCLLKFKPSGEKMTHKCFLGEVATSLPPNTYKLQISVILLLRYPIACPNCNQARHFLRQQRPTRPSFFGFRQANWQIPSYIVPTTTLVSMSFEVNGLSQGHGKPGFNVHHSGLALTCEGNNDLLIVSRSRLVWYYPPSF